MKQLSKAPLGRGMHSKQADQQERSMSLEISLPSGETVIGRVNTNVFMANGNVQIPSTEQEVHFVSLEWPKDIQPVIFFTHWHSTISTPFHERIIKFHISTAENISSNKWEMLQEVVKKCHFSFGAQLLEVTSCRVKLGHPSVLSPYKIQPLEEQMKDTLSCLFADTEYEYCDFMVNWDVTISMGENLHLCELLQPLNSTQSSLSEDVHSPSSSRDGQSEGQQLSPEAEVESDQQGGQMQTDITAEVHALRQIVSKLDRQVNSQFDKVFKQLNELRKIMMSTTLQNPTSFHKMTSGHPVRTSPSPEKKDDRNTLPLSETSIQQTRVIDKSAKTKAKHSRADLKERPQSTKHQSVPAREISKANDRGGKSDSEKSIHKSSRGDLVEDSPDDHHHVNDKDTNVDRQELGEEIKPSRHKPRGINRSSNNDEGRKSHDSNLHRTESLPLILDSVNVRPSNISAYSNYDNSNSISQQIPPTISLNESKQQESSCNSAAISLKQTKSSTLQESTHPSRDKQLKRTSDPSSYRETGFTKETPSKPAKTHQKIHKMKSSEDMISIGLDSDSEARLVKEAVDKAYEFDTEPAPKASSFDTILCLDISSSMMEGGAFDEMKRAVNVFIDGVEDAVNESGTEENIGLVTFGDHAVVAQNLTNDFSRIREKVEALKPEGKSPFVEALLVAMAAFVRKGGIVSVSGEWNVRPRIIFISDGYPTESSEDKGQDVAKNINHVRTAVSRMLISFKASSSFNQVHPIVFVPVGSKADKVYMKAMSEVCGGCYKESGNIRDLCYYFRTQDTIGKVIVCLKDKKETVSQEEIRAVVKALAPDLRHVDEKEIVETIQNELKNPERRFSIKVNPRNVELNNVYENTEKVNLGYFLPLGTRVVRGPDWTYGDQDGNGPGTVISHEKKYSWHWVEWDSGNFNCYPQSPRKGFHLKKTDESPRIKTTNLEIGMVVKKGLKWNKRDGDEHLEKGVIIRKSDKEKKVVVRWSNGELKVCTYSNNGPAEVEYWNGQGSIPNVPGPCKEKEVEGKGIWQWNDGSGNWINYDLSTNELIEKQFLKHNVASVLIYRDGKQRRIMFKRKTERLIDGNLEYDVQRI